MSRRQQKPSPPVTNEALELIASWFRVLSEPSRLRILRSLEEEVYEVKVPEHIAVKAKKSIDRMLEITA